LTALKFHLSFGEIFMNKKLTALAIAMGALTLATAAQAQEKVKIGFITDMSSLYSDVEGKGGVTAIQMAIDDFGGKVLGQPIELMSADHQNKPDIAASKAREWIDTQGITLLFGAGDGQGGARKEACLHQQRRRHLCAH